MTRRILQLEVIFLMVFGLISCGGGGGGSEGSPEGSSSPVFSNIPNQSITLGQNFQDRNLNDYLTDQDTPYSDLTMACLSNGSNLNVNVSQNNVLSIAPFNGSWSGSEAINCTATDPQGNYASTQATYTVNTPLTPSITSSALTNATENQNYNYQVTATDPNNSGFLNFYLKQAPGFLSIGLLTGLVQGIPADGDSAQSYNINVEACDIGNNCGAQSYILNVGKVEDLAGKIMSFDTGSGILGIDVSFVSTTTGSTLSATTDSAGNFQLLDVPDDSYETTLKDMSLTPIYETYKPRITEVNKTKTLQNKLTNLNAKLFLTADRGFINDVMRGTGVAGQQSGRGLEKWQTYKPIWDVYTTEILNGTRVNQSLIDGVTNTIKAEMSQFTQDTYNFTDSDINVIESLPTLPTPQTDGHVIVYWDNSGAVSGGNFSWFNGNEVISAYSRFHTALGKPTWLQELGENLIGSGETNNLNYSNSIFYDPPTATSLSPKDLVVSEAIYNSTYQRLAGNKDYGTPDNHDKDPNGSVWNK